LTGALETRGGEDLSYLSGKGNGAPMRCQFSQCIIEEHYICGKPHMAQGTATQNISMKDHRRNL